MLVSRIGHTAGAVEVSPLKFPWTSQPLPNPEEPLPPAHATAAEPPRLQHQADRGQTYLPVVREALFPPPIGVGSSKVAGISRGPPVTRSPETLLPWLRQSSFSPKRGRGPSEAPLAVAPCGGAPADQPGVGPNGEPTENFDRLRPSNLAIRTLRSL